MKVAQIEDGYAVLAQTLDGSVEAIAEVALAEDEDVIVFFPHENLSFSSMDEVEEFATLIQVCAQAILAGEEVDSEFIY